MVVATSFLTFLWSLIVIFFMVIYFMMLFSVIVDVFRRRDASGWKKAAWLIFLLVVPVIALVSYLVTNGMSMTDRDVARAARSQEQYEAYIRSVAHDGASEIARAKDLRDSGAITEEEFQRLKAKALA
jgi:predicted PurR-regulated permease PerM